VPGCQRYLAGWAAPPQPEDGVIYGSEPCAGWRASKDENHGARLGEKGSDCCGAEAKRCGSRLAEGCGRTIGRTGAEAAETELGFLGPSAAFGRDLVPLFLASLEREVEGKTVLLVDSNLVSRLTIACVFKCSLGMLLVVFRCVASSCIVCTYNILADSCEVVGV
jgi:hypothetical protein